MNFTQPLLLTQKRNRKPEIQETK
uniref:Uncharacterized protein n=1 Tax=Rhizophora mucronata TaxID=61149 RepID=A0A2P2NQI3_RHIMU